MPGKQRGRGGAEELQRGGPGYVSAGSQGQPVKPFPPAGELTGGGAQDCRLWLQQAAQPCSEATVELSRNPKWKGANVFSTPQLPPSEQGLPQKHRYLPQPAANVY